MNQGVKLSSEFWNKTFIDALKNNLGIITHTCNKAGVSPQTYYSYRLKNPSFAEKVDNIKKHICLAALEDTAQTLALKGNVKLLVFMLRNLGGPKWNQDKVEDAMAKTEPQIRQEKKHASPEFEQRLPTKAEIAGAKAYLAAMDDDEE